MNINEVVEMLIKEFNADTYRIRDKNGVVIKLVKEGVKIEDKKNNTRD